LIYLVVLAGVLASAIEVFKLYQSPRMDAFRLTLPGILLLGRYFSFWDILAYWIGIAAAAFLDARLRMGLAKPKGPVRE
jgi:beta-N-acetylhexosaminidase